MTGSSVQRYLYISAAFLGILLLSSCENIRYLYTASPPNNPYLQQKGDAKVTGYYSMATSVVYDYEDSAQMNQQHARGADVQVGYAITDHFAVAGAFLYRDELDRYTNSYSSPSNLKINYTRQRYDLGLGYYTSISNEGEVILNVYLGAIIGRMEFTEKGMLDGMNGYHGLFTTDYYGWYLQPSLNVFAKETLRFGFILKYAQVYYKNENYQYNFTDPATGSLTDNEIPNRPFPEVGMNVQIGPSKLPWLKLDLTGSFIYQPWFFFPHQPKYRGINFSFGITIEPSKF